MKGGNLKSPINGALIAPAVCHPGANAWATEKPHDEIRYEPRSEPDWSASGYWFIFDQDCSFKPPLRALGNRL